MSAKGYTTDYGFIFGAAEVTRICSDKGRVWLSVKTPREEVELYVTRTGLIRIIREGKL